VPGQRHPYLARSGVVLDGIIDQVRDHLSHTSTVTDHVERFMLVEGQFQTGFRSRRCVKIHHIINQLIKLDGVTGQDVFTGIYSGQQKEVIRDLAQPAIMIDA
jgi:hypothetical protein